MFPVDALDALELKFFLFFFCPTLEVRVTYFYASYLQFSPEGPAILYFPRFCKIPEPRQFSTYLKTKPI